ncbi:ankyrin repeat domain-containing protein [Endozoicomonas gorgoniicola]|uniref:Ankyrin repeat domain-containing protein n=1 Tax=Endozoicomonas gorgoniicola TaxID=1234144 RepID=A0ABT3MUJ2_9GAMM|nr:ankyrin repeat domain-containing protein [Endozoicomonas gorgoniicola]MCW7552748.1 ankyrin repeat domain-containing protein [Endozoicomonas gorgoniicola]
MSFIKRIKFANIFRRKEEEVFYSQVAKELSTEILQEALWVKALEKAHGDSTRQISEYIKLRVQSLKDQKDIQAELAGNKRGQTSEINVEAEFIKAPIAKNYKSKKLLKAAESNDYNSVLSALNDITASEQRSLVNKSNGAENTAIHIAARYGNVKIISLLVKNNVGINFINCLGLTPLDIAKNKKHLDAVRLITEAGGKSNPNCQHRY